MSVLNRYGVTVVPALVVFVLTAGLAAQSNSRPFAVTLDGHASPIFQPDGCTIINDEQGTGQAQHMGRITWQSHEVVDVCSNPDGANVVGEMVISAADGDQVFVTYQTLAHLDFVAGQVRALGSYQITGGTGRFVDASGQGIISAVGSLAPPFGVLGQMSGVIGY
jgi:hypothetical protein